MVFEYLNIYLVFIYDFLVFIKHFLVFIIGSIYKYQEVNYKYLKINKGNSTFSGKKDSFPSIHKSFILR